MPLIVQKFGGSSVADTQKILAAARKAIRAQQEGNQVVTVVSAMGDSTDDLIDLAKQISDNPPAREMDMLLSTGEQVSVALMAMAVHALGSKAVSMTGAQMGIETSSVHGKARINTIRSDRLKKALDAGNIVIAAGFQGIDENFNITTLGRGGSDTTAVALAAVLGADACEIYTDVDGVYTTDPRLLPEARRVKQISYDEMLELASLGAGVMHSRSIEFGKKFDVPIHVRSSFTDIPGTMIVAQGEAPNQAVCGATLVKNEARITILGLPDVPGSSFSVFSKIAAKNVTVDMIVQNVAADGRADISFTVVRDELAATLKAVEEAVAELGAEGFTSDENVSKASVVGLGMASQTGVAQRMFRSLADAGINIQMITTSEIKISVLVDREQGPAALRTVHQAFELQKPPANAVTEVSTASQSAHAIASPDAAADVVARLQNVQGMEDLTIDDIQLDDSQARLTISGVPDAPGIAAQVFEQIARDGIFVDMIVQSFGRNGKANLSLTVPRDALTKALTTAGELAKKFSCGPISSAPKVAKLSVSGIGMRSHTGVAIRMFRALAEAGINVEMINTSEVRVNVVVDGAKGAAGLAALQKAFADTVR
ncbi:MAG: aspartate kinase [Planctomycetales bacterium]|nr:aspartate kinase [Planctomycetales bacterium]MBN8629126.1 aspartate kinase [Planctomycetota bacterium]